MSDNGRFRNWMFTINNPAEDVDDPVTWEGKYAISFCIWQKEKGDSGTVHYQGTLPFYLRRSFSKFFNFL